MGVEAEVHAALMGRVESLSLSPAVPVAYPGVPFVDTAGDWLRVTHLRNRPVLRTLAPIDKALRLGMLQLDLFKVIGAGSWQVTADVLADQIAAHFPRHLDMASGGYRVRVFQTWIDPGAKDPDGTHWQTPVMVDYRAYG